MLRDKIDKLKQDYNLNLGKLKSLEQDRNKKKIELINYSNRMDDLRKEKVILEQTTAQARKEAKNKLELLMTNALQYIFNSNYSAEIELGNSGDKPTAEIYLINKVPNNLCEDGYEVIKTIPEEDNGGGIVDILSIALRIATIELFNNSSTVPINGPIIFDEAGKHVSDGYSIKLVEFMKFIAKKMNRQIIIVTHNNDFKLADKKFAVDFLDNSSVVREVTDTELSSLINKE